MGELDYITIDSCHSLWIFDPSNQRFRRVLKGLGHGSESARTEWRFYHELDLDPDSDAFVVVLNHAGTRMLRSWRHQGVTCLQCGASGTEELSLESIALAE
jgi:hypothetical protein